VQQNNSKLGMKKIRPIAVYLPQYHPIKENDEWWGKGFTEWTKVTKARPRFKDHYQPHLPADLGFYDLRLADIREEQAKMAQQYGIEGFCYYHYWFNGKRVLERPLNEVLQSGTPDFPFCVCWANENWTRRWDGQDQEVLLKQEYSFEDDLAHIKYLCESVFSDKRYIRVDGKPLFIVYRPKLFPNMKRTTEIWREEARKNGTGEIYLAYMQSFGDRRDPEKMGFDAAIEFQPAFSAFYVSKKWRIKDKILRKLRLAPGKIFKGDKFFYYEKLIGQMMRRPDDIDYKLFPGIFPMWDNSARREKEATIIHGSTPELYGKWLRHILHKFKPFSIEENFVFINAWNEWAEGNHLEPCQKWGRAYLETTKKCVDEVN
jgi:lipopolysaccharide biosynthesis protein